MLRKKLNQDGDPETSNIRRTATAGAESGIIKKFDPNGKFNYPICTLENDTALSAFYISTLKVKLSSVRIILPNAQCSIPFKYHPTSWATWTTSFLRHSTLVETA